MRQGEERGGGGAWRGGRRSVAGLTPRAQPGWGSSHEWSDAVTSARSVTGDRTRYTAAGSDASAGAADAVGPAVFYDEGAQDC
jgi:hypothetical protein